MMRWPFVLTEKYDELFAKWCGASLREDRALARLARTNAENAVLKERVRTITHQLNDAVLAASLGPTGRVKVRDGKALQRVIVT